MAGVNDIPGLSITIEAGPPTVVHVQGEIDISTSERFGASLAEGLDAAPSDAVIFDLAGVTFIDSSGLAALISIVRGGHPVLVRNASPAVHRIVGATGLEDILQFEQ
jgi:anti-sigma B factor antagonist